MKLAKRMLFNKRGSLYGAILAVTIGILVIHVNFVIFQGLYDAIVRDITEYRNGDVRVTDEDDYIDNSDSSILSWFARISSFCILRILAFTAPPDIPKSIPICLSDSLQLFNNLLRILISKLSIISLIVPP